MPIKRHYKVLVIGERCKDCGICVYICPTNVFEKSRSKMNRKGYWIVSPSHPELCVGCKICEYICPEFAIVVKYSPKPYSEVVLQIES